MHKVVFTADVDFFLTDCQSSTILKVWMLNRQWDLWVLSTTSWTQSSPDKVNTILTKTLLSLENEKNT